MSKISQVNAAMSGFQVNVAIILMIKNIEDLKSLRLEGNYVNKVI